MLGQFAVVSGTGWAIDFIVFYSLCHIGMPVYGANLIGASLAVLFVFFASLRPIFLYQGTRTSSKLIRYVLYQAAAIPAASICIDLISRASLPPLWAKILVTPITFLCNFLFMRYLSRTGMPLR